MPIFGPIPRQLLNAVCLSGAMTASLAVPVAGAIPEPAPPSKAMDARRHAADNVGAVVWLPLDTSAQDQPGPRSKASYTLEPACPAGTWRWQANGTHTNIVFVVATALIIRVEGAEGSDSRQDLLAAAGEAISEAFRIGAGLEAGDAEGLAIRFPGARDAAGELLRQWENTLDGRSESASKALARAISEFSTSKISLTAIVAREHVDATSAPIEVCQNGRWTPAGDRVISARRTPLAPHFHGPLSAGAVDAAGAAQSAGQLLPVLCEWLRTHYAREAAAAAILAHGGDLTAQAGEESIVASPARKTPSEE